MAKTKTTHKAPKKPTAKSELTRKRILQAAIRVIARQGIESASTREIASEAGVANGLVSRYVQSRADLFSLVIQEIAFDAYAKIESAPEELSGLEKIVWMGEKNLGFFLDNPNYAKCFLLFYYFAAIDPKFRALNREMDQRAIERLEAYWRQHSSESGREKVGSQDVREIAETLHARTITATIKFFSVPHSRDRSTYTDQFVGSLRRLAQSLEIYHSMPK